MGISICKKYNNSNKNKMRTTIKRTMCDKQINNIAKYKKKINDAKIGMRTETHG